MPKLTIDGRAVEVEEGSTILDAARRLDIDVPTLCYLPGLEPWTSCMVCVVRLAPSGKLVPSCSTKAVDGMVVECDVEQVRDARRAALELLLSDHLGDCVAPCQTACPAHMNIPLMLRHIAAGDDASAVRVVRERIPLAAVLGYVCPAPCEKACRRRAHDGALAICKLERHAGETALAATDTMRLPAPPASGQRVAVVGAGPAGLTAAYYLRADGHDVTVCEREEKPGGALRSSIDDAVLPRRVLDAEIAVLLAAGVTFAPRTDIGSAPTLTALRREFDAVAVAAGPLDGDAVTVLGLDASRTGIAVDAATMQTSLGGVFACGASVKPTKMAVRSVADGRAVAACVSQFLAGEPVTGVEREWTCRIGKLLDGELASFVALASDAKRADAADAGRASLSRDEARAEAARCLHCDCRKPDACRLRQHAAAYGADARRYTSLGSAAEPTRRRFEQNADHGEIVYESGKCIDCGICVRIAEEAREELGLTFIGRGFDVRVRAPFDESLSAALRRVAARCAESCPTGALARKTD